MVQLIWAQWINQYEMIQHQQNTNCSDTNLITKSNVVEKRITSRRFSWHLITFSDWSDPTRVLGTSVQNMTDNDRTENTLSREAWSSWVRSILITCRICDQFHDHCSANGIVHFLYENGGMWSIIFEWLLKIPPEHPRFSQMIVKVFYIKTAILTDETVASFFGRTVGKPEVRSGESPSCFCHAWIVIWQLPTVLCELNWNSRSKPNSVLFARIRRDNVEP